MKSFTLVFFCSVCLNRTWHKLQKVMRNWLQTTGSDEDAEERENIIQELNQVLGFLSVLAFDVNFFLGPRLFEENCLFKKRVHKSSPFQN